MELFTRPSIAPRSFTSTGIAILSRTAKASSSALVYARQITVGW
uniref:T-complex protein 1 subunit gamma n=1 Tax=Arundo donax TaxID=35708 RepID=A0A0A9F4Q0_ARUDO